MWEMKKLNFDLTGSSKQIIYEFIVLDEFFLKEYDSSYIYKEKIRTYHDRRMEKQEFMLGDLVLLFNSRLRSFLRKLKYKWTVPFLINQSVPTWSV